FLKYMQSRIEHASHPLLVCKIGSEFPLCIGVWRPVLPEIQRRLNSGNLSVRSMLEAGYTGIISEEELTELVFGLSMFRYTNTVDDYPSALLLLGDSHTIFFFLPKFCPCREIAFSTTKGVL